MRNDPSDAEYRLWYFLRACQLDGVKFRRQAVVGRYIVDFVTFERKLIVELDGGQHAQRKKHDDRRKRWLNTQGFRVLRFWNHEALEDTEAVVEVIARAIRDGAAGVEDREIGPPP
jgi:very-short-patch-repair endonuclease